MDETLFTGNNYYRLLEKDIDGTLSYSRVVAVFAGNPSEAIQIIPIAGPVAAFE